MDGLEFGIHKHPSILRVMNPFDLYKGGRHQIFVFRDGAFTEPIVFVG